jgi:hypothetical protein
MAKVSKAVYRNGTPVLEKHPGKEAQGKEFTVIVLEETGKQGNGQLIHVFDLAGNIDLDETATRQSRETSML